MQQVLIVGANGRLGQAVLAAFAAAGWVVWAHTRRPLLPRPGELGGYAAHGGPIQPISGELGQLLARYPALQQVTVVVNALNPTYRDWSGWPVLQAPVTALTQALGALLIMPANVYPFGAQMPAALHEDTPLQPTTGKGRIRQQLEDSIRTTPGLDSVLLRAGDFYGGAQPGTFVDQVFAPAVRRGRLPYLGATDLPHAWAYLPDFAACIVALACQRAAVRGSHTWHFPGHTLTGQDWLQALSALSGRALRFGRFPWFWLRPLALVRPDLHGLLEMRYLWDTPHALRGQGLAQRLGEWPSTPFSTALAHTWQAQRLPC